MFFHQTKVMWKQNTIAIIVFKHIPHSSRMRTVRSSSHVYSSMHWAGGCIPACTGQGVYPSMHWVGGVSQRALGRGVSAQGGVCLGVSAQGGCLPRGCLPRKGGFVCVSQHALGQTSLPVNKMTDGCKNITLPQLRCGW